MAVRLRAFATQPGKVIGFDDRTSTWLSSAYGDSKWIILDTAGAGSPETVNFDVRMADGRSLLDHPKLLATAKEFAYWIREGNYTRLDDAARHKQYAETMIRLCYGLSARGINSVSDLTSIDIDIICEDATAGLDGLTSASKILKKKLSEFETWDDVPAEFKAGDNFAIHSILDAFNLPRTWSRIELKSEFVSAQARLNGKLLASVADSKDRPVTIQNVQIVTTIFEALHALRYFMEAPSIKFRPFPEGAAKRADDLGRTTDRTPIPHPDLVLSLLENATRYIANNCDRTVSQYKSVLDAASEGVVSREAASKVHARIEMLATACFILIAAFTARRTEEIKLLSRDCLEGNDESGWWMRVYIEKTERAQTLIPVPRIVARAVSAVASFRETDAVNDGDLLWDYFQPILRRITKPSPEGNVNQFAKMVGCHEHANDNGPVEPWHWQARQFRRFFAVLYFYRYKGKIETLAHHLRHFNLEMTNDYVALDPEVSEIWTREQFRYQVSVARDLVTGRTHYTGPMGERLNRLVEKVRGAFEKNVIILTDTMARIVVRTMKKQHLVITPKPWVDCSCPRDRRGCEKAACRKVAGWGPNDLGPDFSAAGPTICPGCPWALFNDEHINFFDVEIEAMKSELPLENHPTIFAELQLANIVKLSTLRDSLKA